MVVIVALNEFNLMVELNISTSGFTVTDMPYGFSMMALYIELGGPTFVTVRVSVTEFRRLGMVIEGTLTSKIEGLVSGHVVTCPTR